MGNRVARFAESYLAPWRDRTRRGTPFQPVFAGSLWQRRCWLQSLSAVVCLGGVALGCGGNPGPSTGAFQSSSFDSLFIVVENQNFYDAAVFLQFQGGNRRRLATVSAYSTERHSIRYDPSEMWFLVDFVGARLATRSQSLSLNPGETVHLQLPANAHRTGQLITLRQ